MLGLRHAHIVTISVALAFVGCGSCEEEATDQLERGRAQLEEGASHLLRRGEDDDPDPVEASPPPPAREGNRARLLINGEASFLERLRILETAEESIYVQALIFKADTVGCAIADRLIAKKRDNPDLDIQVIVDAYANIQDYDAQMLYFELMDAGIPVHGYEPLYLEWIDEIDLEDWTAGNKRYHEKYFVVDGERAVVGGMNVGDEYARVGDDPVLIWRDQDIFLEGPVVADVARAFRENARYFRRIHDRRPGLLDSDGYWSAWRRIHPDLRESVTEALGRDRAWSRPEIDPLDVDDLTSRQVQTEAHDGVEVQFIRSRPRLGERWIDEVYREHIEAAESSIVIANAYFIPTDELREALEAAARRGVEVTVITNSKETNDIPLINDAGRVSYQPLIDAGVRVYEWHAERHGEGTLHAKLAVFDSQTAIIGSYNLDPRSLALNSEDVVVVDHPGIAAELHRRVIETDLEYADRISVRQARAWSDPELIPVVDQVPDVPFWDPRFDADRFELFLIGQASKSL
jgi:putative cardiolipin synthase